MTLYHGSSQIISKPEIRNSKLNKDFSTGFYCTLLKEQAIRWATRFDSDGYINIFEYMPQNNLNILKFEKMTDEWLDFIVACRSGKTHEYDIVEGPMADDTIYNYVQGYIDGKYSREAFWALAKFKYPTHQISFHTQPSLCTLKFLEGVLVHGKK